MTGDQINYKYIGTNSPEKKINYSYSIFGGKAFLESYQRTREIVGSHTIDKSCIQLVGESSTPTEKMFNDWINNLNDGGNLDFEKLHLLLKRFEVTKKIYEDYDQNFRPHDRSQFHCYRLYVLFAYVLSLCYAKYRKLQYLNSLLKVNDIMISLVNELDESSRDIVLYCVQSELAFVDELGRELL